MSLLGSIYRSTIVCIIFPFNVYIRFRHLKTYKARMELVLRITRVIILIYTVLDRKGFESERIKLVDFFVTEEQ